MSLQSLLSTRLLRAGSLRDSAYDGVILVTNCAKLVSETPALKDISSAVQDFIEVGCVQIASHWPYCTN